MRQHFLCSESFPVLLVANKVDLLHSRKISEEKGKEIANQLGVEYIETSAKEPPLNIDTAFHQVDYSALHIFCN